VAACSPTSQGGDELDGRPDVTAHEPGTAPKAEADLTVADAAQVTPSIPALALQLDPAAMLAAYKVLAARGDDECPAATVSEADGETITTWETECTATDGTSFKGNFTLSESNGSDGAESSYSLESELFEIVGTDGLFVRGSPSVYTSTETSAEGTTYQLSSFGSFVTDESTAAGNPWMLGELRGVVGIYAEATPEYRVIGFEGSFSLSASSAGESDVTAVALEEFVIHDNFCTVGTHGSISLRSSSGAWHEGYFAPAFDDEPSPAEFCNTCGNLLFAGSELGEFCAEEAPFSNLLAWETTPW